jgi:uncharacterized repeat protein (TIGR03803 family)
MSDLSWWRKACAVFMACAATPIGAHAQTFTNLVNFGGNNGYGPYSMSLVQGVDGNYYGTTAFGGAYDNGTVFRITQEGVVTVLYSFCREGGCTDGNDVVAGLVLATDGKFYGTTYSGGTLGGGVTFKVTSSGGFADLYNFCRGHSCTDMPENPEAPLIQGPDGNLYGTSISGGHFACGSSTGCGTLFGITPQGKLTGVYPFCAKSGCADGDVPLAGVVQGTDGAFYGTTSGAASGYGTIFRITPGGSLTTLYSFCSQPNCSDGADPFASLIQGLDGNFYGTTSQGGNADPMCGVGGCGTAFKVTPTGILTTLYAFCSQYACADGYSPQAGLIQGTDGNFYGTTFLGGSDLIDCTAQGSGCGTVFQLAPEGALSTLHSFSDTDGAYIHGGLLQATNGIIYGTTSLGGDLGCQYQSLGCGTTFSINMGLDPFVSFVRNPAMLGQSFGILGQSFEGTTGVALNGTTAAFTVNSDTFIEATVPAGATTGYVTVATPSGTLTSNVPFRVIP